MAREWSVLVSHEDAEGSRCVDIFRRADGSFGFEAFRRDPEDRSGWFVTGYYSGLRHASRDEALAAAMASVGWLRDRRTGPSGGAGPCGSVGPCGSAT